LEAEFLEMSTTIKLSEAYSMGTQKRETQFIKSKDIIETPGPGTYAASKNSLKAAQNPSWSMSKDQRDKNFSNSGPGPGTYQLKPKITEGPKYILGLKPFLDPHKNRTAPGPGFYNPQKG